MESAWDTIERLTIDYKIQKMRNRGNRKPYYCVKPETPRWRADFDECYWRVGLFTVFPCSIYAGKDRRNEVYDYSYEMGNYFETEKEAQLVANLINKIFELICDGVPASEIEVKQIEK